MYGSDMINVNFEKGKETRMLYDLSMTEMRAVDQPNQRCSNDEEPPNLSRCLVESIESITNCSLQLHWFDESKEKCNVTRNDGIWNVYNEEANCEFVLPYRIHFKTN